MTKFITVCIQLNHQNLLPGELTQGKKRTGRQYEVMIIYTPKKYPEKKWHPVTYFNFYKLNKYPSSNLMLNLNSSFPPGTAHPQNHRKKTPLSTIKIILLRYWHFHMPLPPFRMMHPTFSLRNLVEKVSLPKPTTIYYFKT